MRIVAQTWPKNFYSQPEEAHPIVEVLICKEGAGSILVEGEAHPVRAGDILYIPAGIRHADTCSEPRRNGILRFDPVESLPNEFRIFHDPGRRLEQLYDLAADALLLPDQENRAFAYSLGDTMLLLLIGWCSEPRKESNSAVDAIDQLIRQRFNDADFDLTEEILRSGYSISYFRQLFHRQIGRPPQAQLNYVRIEFAKTQIQFYGDSLPIKTISVNSGFQDPYYFSRVFKQLVGKSPSDYLEELGRPQMNIR